MRRSVAAAPLGMLLAASLCACASAAGSPWSSPVLLARCAAPGPVDVLFSSDGPTHRTGEGAIVWSAQPGCGRAGAPQTRHPATRVAVIGADDRARAVHGASVTAPADPTGATGAVLPESAELAAGAPLGRMVLAGPTALGTVVFEGAPEGPLGAVSAPLHRTAAVALTNAYRGDVALAWAGAGGTVWARVQRYFSSAFGPPATLARAGAGVRELAVALDYRTDLMAAWWQGGWLWARWRRRSGSLERVQRLAQSSRPGQLVALNSDDGHGMVAWLQQRSGWTSVRIAISAPRARFDGSQLLERYRDPGGVPPGAGSLRLIRRSDERVVIAWPGVRDGAYAVRLAGVTLAGVRPPVTFGSAGAEAALEDLAPGPRNDVEALWTESPTSGSAAARTLLAARGEGRGDALRFAPPQRLAGPGAISDASVAFDPDSDEALAAWREGGEIRYAVYAPQGPVQGAPLQRGASASSAGVGWVVYAAGAAALALVAGAATARTRSGRRSR